MKKFLLMVIMAVFSTFVFAASGSTMESSGAQQPKVQGVYLYGYKMVVYNKSTDVVRFTVPDADVIDCRVNQDGRDRFNCGNHDADARGYKSLDGYTLKSNESMYVLYFSAGNEKRDVSLAVDFNNTPGFSISNDPGAYNGKYAGREKFRIDADTSLLSNPYMISAADKSKYKLTFGTFVDTKHPVLYIYNK